MAKAKTTQVRVSYQGDEYELPMTATEIKNFGKVFNELIASKGEDARKRRDGNASRVRQWAIENGYPVGKRGRLDSSVWEGYASGTPYSEPVETTDETSAEAELANA